MTTTVNENFDTRYELKQAYSELQIPELRSWVQMHPAGFHTAYPPRWVNSLYFDTHGLDTFNDHIAGVPVRRKLRYRWYGEDLKVARRGQVEVKNKSELAGWKLIEKLEPDFELGGKSWAALTNEFCHASSGLTQELLSVARPVLLTVYHREYFVSADSQVRLTIDSKMKGYDQYFQARPNLYFPNRGDEQVVLELKCRVGRVTKLTEALSHFPARAMRYSKYVTNIWQDLV
ncbi:MAG: polyphosphate polymerase domain-containing protein [Anaerolineales bacterium]|nr:polyphosphate polymerase domain-containing protein [Anaerolineales bacterium]